MIVVILVGIFAVMATPAMARARVDRHVYEDAATFSDLVREARSRAIGRGAAVVIFGTTQGSQGTFHVYEAVTPGPTAGSLVPFSSCRGVRWAVAADPATLGSGQSAANRVRVYDINADYEKRQGIAARLFLPGANTPVNNVALCFTPLGRAYLAAQALTNGMFDTVAPMNGAAQVEFAHVDPNGLVGLARRVLVPTSGLTRIQSVPALIQ